MLESQYAVFKFDVRTIVMAGEQPIIFESLPEAERYCRESIVAVTSIGCRILDYHGKTIGTFVDDKLYSKHHGQPAARRNLLLGVVFLIAGISSVGLDAYFGWRLVFGVLLGVRFLWAGCVKTIDGATALRSQKMTSEARNQKTTTRFSAS